VANLLQFALSFVTSATTPIVYMTCTKKKCTTTSFNCGLTIAKISASVIINEKLKASLLA